MSSDNSSNNNNNNNNHNHQNKPPSPPPADMHRNRRGSITMPFVNIFQRSNSIAGGTPVYPGTIANAANQRRLSLTTQVGLTGTSPTSANLAHRGSLSTNSSDYDENVIEEEDFPASARTAPVTPFTTRRVSFGTAAGMRRPGATSPGTSNGRHTTHSAVLTTPPLEEHSGNSPVSRAPHNTPTSVSASAMSWKPPPSHTTQTQPMPRNPSVPLSRRPRATSDLFTARSDQGFNWSEQLRSRAESTVSGSRPSFSFASGLTNSPPRLGAVPPSGGHDRNKSVSEMPAPPAQAPKPRSPPRDTRPKPDHFQERILKGDFYMD